MGSEMCIRDRDDPMKDDTFLGPMAIKHLKEELVGQVKQSI